MHDYKEDAIYFIPCHASYGSHNLIGEISDVVCTNKAFLSHDKTSIFYNLVNNLMQ